MNQPVTPDSGDGLKQQQAQARLAQYVVFQLAEVAVPRQLFAAILHRIGRLRLACSSG
jgi:hypothetical protein